MHLSDSPPPPPPLLFSGHLRIGGGAGLQQSHRTGGADSGLKEPAQSRQGLVTKSQRSAQGHLHSSRRTNSRTLHTRFKAAQGSTRSLSHLSPPGSYLPDKGLLKTQLQIYFLFLMDALMIFSARCKKPEASPSNINHLTSKSYTTVVVSPVSSQQCGSFGEGKSVMHKPLWSHRVSLEVIPLCSK